MSQKKLKATLMAKKFDARKVINDINASNSDFLDINHKPGLKDTYDLVCDYKKFVQNYIDQEISREELIFILYAAARKRCRAYRLNEKQLTMGDCGSSALAVSMVLEAIGISSEIVIACADPKYHFVIDSGRKYPLIGHIVVSIDGKFYDWSGRINEKQILRNLDIKDLKNNDSEDISYDSLVVLKDININTYKNIWSWFRRSTGYLVYPVSYMDAMIKEIDKIQKSIGLNILNEDKILDLTHYNEFSM